MGDTAAQSAADAAGAQKDGNTPSGRAPTPVEQAFALGWHVGELYHMESDAGAATEPPDALNQINNLDFAKRASLLVAQIQTGLESLRLEPISGFTTIASAASRNAVMAKDDLTPAKDGASLGDMASVHETLLEDLTAMDFRLGKAYAVGVGLGETVVLGYRHLTSEAQTLPPQTQPLQTGQVDPKEKEYVATLFDPVRVQPITRQLRDLKTAFEPYAIDAVVATMLDWADTRDLWNSDYVHERKRVANQLYHQGSIWRAMLSGEKAATDYLVVADYAKAIADLLRNYTQMAAQFGLTRTTLTVAGLFSFIVIAAGFVIGYFFHAGIQGVYTAAIGLFSVFGLSSATAIAAVKSAVSTAEQELWKAELSAAIADSIGWAPAKPPTPNAVALRKGRIDSSIVFTKVPAKPVSTAH